MSKKQNVSPLHPQAEQGKPAEEQQSPIPGMSREEFNVNVRKTAEATKNINVEELGYCKKCIEELEKPDLNKLRLPILIHNFIILAPQFRFKILEEIETLMRELVRSLGLIKMISTERRAAVKVLNDIKEVMKFDKEEEYAQVDISQFLTAYYQFMIAGKYEDNHAQRKCLKNIRDYMTEKLKTVKAQKEQAIANCDDLLKHKLAGE